MHFIKGVELKVTQVELLLYCLFLRVQTFMSKDKFIPHLRTPCIYVYLLLKKNTYLRSEGNTKMGMKNCLEINLIKNLPFNTFGNN